MSRFVLILIAFGLSVSSHAALMTYSLENLESTGYYNADYATRSWYGDGYIAPRNHGLGQWFHMELEDSRDHSRVMAQVDTSSLLGASIISATVSFDLAYARHFNHAATPQGRITSFNADGSLEYSFPDAPSDLGSVIFDGVAGSNTIDITGLFTNHITSGESWFGMFFSPVGDSLLVTGTSSDADAAKLRLNVEYAAAVVPEPSSLAILFIGLAGVGLLRRKRTI